MPNNINNIFTPLFEKYKDHVVFAYLFGSAATGNESKLSDVDIAIFIREGKGESCADIKLSLYADICRVLKRNDVDVLVLNTATNIILLDEIIRDGIVLFDRDPDLRKEFEYKVLHEAIDFKEQRIAVMGI